MFNGKNVATRTSYERTDERVYYSLHNFNSDKNKYNRPTLLHYHHMKTITSY